MSNGSESEGNKREVPAHFKRLGREFAMQFLYQKDFASENIEAELTNFWSQAESSGSFKLDRVFRKAREFAERLIRGVSENIAKIDSEIAKHSEKWDMSRMAAVDRNIMRVAVYEMFFCPDVPPVVSIDEAVAVAKAYSSEKSGFFINGILNGIMETLDRPPRKAVKSI